MSSPSSTGSIVARLKSRNQPSPLIDGTVQHSSKR